MKRNFTKNGFKSLIKTWGQKSTKYVNDFIIETLEDDVFLGILSTVADYFII